MRLKDRVALVTGGGSGIGAAICKRFAQEGAVVVVTDINADAAAETATQITANGGRAEAMQQDVTDEQRWAVVVDETVGTHGGLHILVNNAGIGIPASVEDTTLADWRAVNAVNLDGVFLGTRAAIAVMKASGGSIINLSSIEGIVGDPILAAYNASKGGVRLFTKSAALHCADSGYGIRINSIHPGFIETPILDGAEEKLGQAGAEEFLTRVMASIPVGELGKPEDIANGALFLASDESRYMTGSELVIDGGLTAR